MPVLSSGLNNSCTMNTKKDNLEFASKVVDQHMLIDGSYAELVECLKMGGNLPSVSGLEDCDYPGASELGLSFHSLAQLNVVRKIPLPPELLEQIDLMRMNIQMGLFPEIGRAWLTVDSNIFLWRFEDGSDVAYYDGLTQAILCIGLAKPKPGVFQSYIKYVLCVATPVEILLLGVSFGQQTEHSTPHEEMHLLPEPLFRFPTDNIIMSCFGATDGGRIFLGGKDGNIYEFAYQAPEGWFRRKCRKINHGTSALSFLVPAFFQVFSKQDPISQITIDNSRNIFYILSESGAIQVFDLGVDGNVMKKVTSLTQQIIVNKAVAVAKTIDQKHFSPIVKISAIEAAESKQVNLVAISSTGVRLYFSTNIDLTSSRPYTLSLLHVRMPPGFTANAIGDKPSNVHHALYRKGFLMLACKVIEDHDFLFTTCSDTFLSRQSLVETNAGLGLDGHVWDLAEIPSSDTKRWELSTADVALTTDPPQFITQHSECPRRFVVLSSQGSSILTKPRPVDQLRRLLLAGKGSDNDTVKAFFRIHGEAQACAMCLILACNQSPQNQQVAEWATRAFFMYGGNFQTNVISGGGDSGIETQFSLVEPSRNPIWASTPVQRGISQPHGLFSPVHPNTLVPQSMTMPGSFIGQQPVQAETQRPLNLDDFTSFSPKHDGLYLYYSRIMRPLWNLKLIKEELIPFHNPPQYVMYATVPGSQVTEFFQQLKSLNSFMQRHYVCITNAGNERVAKTTSHLASASRISTLEVSSVGPQQTSNTPTDVQERTSLQSLQFLVSYTCEVLGLWKVLCDHQIGYIFTSLEKPEQDLLKQMTFKDLIVDGLVFCSLLASALINYYLEDDADTSSVSQRLRDVCPTIYKAEDAIISKAQEKVMNAKTIANSTERRRELVDALKLCKSVCVSMDVGEMCNTFRGADFYSGIVDLCLVTAQKIDPQNLAVHFYKNGKPANDQQGQNIFLHRNRLYGIIINTLADLREKSARPQPQVPNAPSSPNQPTLTPDEAKKQSELVFAMSLKSEDELFHCALYDWLIEHQHTDALLAVNSFFLEEYLKRRTAENPECVQSLDLLWKFYEKSQNFSAAARVLAKLVDKDDLDLNLAKRIEYLSRSIMCVKSSEMRSSVAGEGEFLQDLEEKMEVARIQLQILEILQHRTGPGIQESISKLNSNLMNITELFEEYAMPYDLPEIKLVIVCCADHHDPGLVESLWQSIIDKEVAASSGNLPEAIVKILQRKIESLSQTYVKSSKFFPIAFIIKYLEFKSCSMDCPLSWVYETILNIGVSMTEILNIYHKMYRAKDTCWLTVKRPFHLLHVLCLLIGDFANDPTSMPPSERRAFANLCLDFIAGYLVDLQAAGAIDETISALSRNFKSVQHSLERLAV